VEAILGARRIFLPFQIFGRYFPEIAGLAENFLKSWG
jgi:hypothetical protein